MDSKDKEVIKEFIKEFNKIKEMGFIESRRFHDTGIGKTCEDFMKVIENNKKSADYKGVIEIKSTRELSEAMVTLFTKSPEPRGTNTKLRINFGYPDTDFPKVMVLHTTFSGDKFNNSKNKFGFMLNIDSSQENIFIKIKDLETDTINDSIVAYYPFDVLKEAVEEKLKTIAFIKAEHKKKDGKEFFKFNKAIILYGLTFEKFLSFIKEGLIKYDFRLGIYKTGNKRGTYHDHGSGFRILKKDINKVFKIMELD